MLLHQKFHWINWAYPIANGRQNVDDDTPVPQTDAEYSPIVDHTANAGEEDQATPVMGSAIEGIWKSYVAHDFEKEFQSSMITRRRLPVFASLGYGHEISKDRSLPHISRKYINDESSGQVPSRSSEVCWRALLTQDEEFEEFQPENEWDIVRRHFLNSEAKQKMLSIIQQ